MIDNLRAIVLWSRRSREADKIIGLYSDRRGRVTARATSAARSTAKFAALTEPFVECEIALYLKPGQAWGKIVGGRLLSSHPRLRGGLERSTAAAWVCEIVHRLTPEEQPSPEKFELLRAALGAIEAAPRFRVLRLGFAVRFLSMAGFGLDLRDPWIRFADAHPDRADQLKTAPLEALSESLWEGPEVSELEQLTASVVYDHLHRPLLVNRFRQMAGVEI